MLYEVITGSAWRHDVGPGPERTRAPSSVVEGRNGGVLRALYFSIILASIFEVIPSLSRTISVRSLFKISFPSFVSSIVPSFFVVPGDFNFANAPEISSSLTLPFFFSYISSAIFFV